MELNWSKKTVMDALVSGINIANAERFEMFNFRSLDVTIGHA